MKISVIVPVYKAEKHVGATLDSLVGQTHHDLEIVCVNDGSPDGSGRILKDYAARDARIRVIEQENQGVSAARNTGMAHATGDILMFVDADDALLPHACARVNEIFEAQSPEVLTFGLACDPPEAAPASLRRELSPADNVYEGFKAALLFKEYARPYACRTAISRAFALRENVCFEPGLPLAEDQVFYFAVYPFSRRSVLSSEKLYLYRMNDESVTHESTDGRRALLKKLDSHLKAIEAICRIWDERDMRDFCAAELLEWCLDFTMLDIGKLPAADQRACYARLMTCLDGHFGQPCERFAERRPTKACLKDIRNALASSSSDATHGGDTPSSATENPAKATADGALDAVDAASDIDGDSDARTMTDPAVVLSESRDGTAAERGVITPFHKVSYYLMRRGFVRCAERVLMKAGLAK